jgi:lysophospholipase L1-like esterase
VNDAATPVSLATYISNMAAIIATVQAAGGDVLLTGPIPSGGAFIARDAVERDYAVNGLSSLAATYGCGVVDLNARFVSFAVSNPLGYYFDDVHPTEFGYADMAQAIFNALKTI